MTSFEHDRDLAALARRIEPTDDDVARAVAGARRRTGPRRGVAVPAAVAAAALVAAGGFVLRPGPPAPVEIAGVGVIAVAPGVTATADGEGTHQTFGVATEVAWRRGRLSVDVDPTAGRRVAVRTDEAVVTVKGTVFDVDRGPFGTEVSVSRGRVAVACTSAGRSAELIEGQTAFCLRDAGAGLGRVLRLEGEGVGPAARLSAVELALSHPIGDAAVRATLDARREALWRELASAALTSGDCAGARPWLAALVDRGDPDATLALDRCGAR
jgi:hypothetical protein